jgi:hypothetical protein
MDLEKFCGSCGMPLREKKDFGGGKLDNKYCVYCCDENGNLFPYETVLKNMANFIVKMNGISFDKAEKIARDNMDKMPAWMGKNNL